MPNLGTGLVGKWLTTMDGNLRARQQGRAVGEYHVRRIAPFAASDANGYRSTAALQHGRGGTAAARLIIRGRLGLDEGRGEGERGLRAWPWLALMMIMMMLVAVRTVWSTSVGR